MSVFLIIANYKNMRVTFKPSYVCTRSDVIKAFHLSVQESCFILGVKHCVNNAHITLLITV